MIWRGVVLEVLSTGRAWVQIPALAGTDPVGPLDVATLPGPLSPGARVLVAALDGQRRELMIIGTH